jgi:hypothetical protein
MTIEIEDSENLFGEDLIFEVEVDYHVTPYFSGNWENPPEGGEVEINSFSWSIQSEDGKDKNLILSFFSKEKIKEIDGWIEEKLNNDSRILEHLEEHYSPNEYEYDPDEHNRCD